MDFGPTAYFNGLTKHMLGRAIKRHPHPEQSADIVQALTFLRAQLSLSSLSLCSLSPLSLSSLSSLSPSLPLPLSLSLSLPARDHLHTISRAHTRLVHRSVRCEL